MRDTANLELLEGAADGAGETADASLLTGSSAYRLVMRGRIRSTEGRRSPSRCPRPRRYGSWFTTLAAAWCGRWRKASTLPVRHAVEWDGTDLNGRALTSGIYFYAMQAGAWQSQKRMTLLR